MTLKELQNYLSSQDTVEIYLPDGKRVPKHFHVTELAANKKTFIDCGNTLREEEYIGFQLWVAADIYHRLKADKLYKVIEHGKNLLSLDDEKEVRVEYQGDTIETYGLSIVDEQLRLTALKTDCLAQDLCGIVDTVINKPINKMVELASSAGCCTPGGGCC